MVTEQAELNRSRFYCHFKSMDDLVDRVTEDEVLGNGSVLQNMLSLVAGSMRQPTASRRSSSTTWKESGM